MQGSLVASRAARRNISGTRLFSSCRRHQDVQSHLPKIASPALWRGMIPKALRNDGSTSQELSSTQSEAPTRRERPGLPLIILGLLAGSFAINIISLRREMANFSRKTETKLALLREVVQKVKNGEAVDVKRLLGTGDPESEQEWEEVIKELETTDMLARGQAKKAARRASREEQREKEQALRNEKQATSKDKEQSRPKFMM
ncbi:hypothetical protein AMS68_003748 [Peltaster fructicola]|uniref:Uncharacterized protein n=1 Tax=Peltaster fructicola TaxID=286661 RepID=A0A6H0XU87_9PEZI|nr:hypothetical protein AMS68_003748 [Peltaster fructicola]